MCSHVRYWHLPRNARMHLTLRGLCAPRKWVTLGHCSFRLFSKKGRLKSGRRKVLPTTTLLVCALVEENSRVTREGLQVAMELYSTPPGTSNRDTVPEKAVQVPGAVEQATAGGDDGAELSGGAEAQAATATPLAANLVDKRSLMDKLDKLMQRYDSNGMARCGWLDVLALRRIDQLNQVPSPAI